MVFAFFSVSLFSSCFEGRERKMQGHPFFLLLVLREGGERERDRKVGIELCARKR